MKKLRGFLLLEAAIAVCVVGILTAIMTPWVHTLTVGARHLQTQRAYETVFRALDRYIACHGWLPCAALESEGMEQPGVFVGTVPYRTLCLEKASVMDGERRVLTYVVHPYLTLALPANPFEAITAAPLTFATVSGENRLYVVDAQGVPVIPEYENKDFCAVVLLSLSAKNQDASIRVDPDGIEVILPGKGASTARWKSRNNICPRND